MHFTLIFRYLIISYLNTPSRYIIKVKFVCCLLKNKNQLSKCKNQTDFIKQFMNQAASHSAYRKELQGAVQNENLL